MNNYVVNVTLVSVCLKMHMSCSWLWFVKQQKSTKHFYLCNCVLSSDHQPEISNLSDCMESCSSSAPASLLHIFPLTAEGSTFHHISIDISNFPYIRSWQLS